MCGIFALLNNITQIDKDIILENFAKGSPRGPEISKYERVGDLIEMGFHRLAINGIDSKSDQPMNIDDITIICNGEIYNYKELFASIDVTPITNSDCEIIIHIYKKYGIEYTLSVLDGVFAFVLYDNRTPEPVIHVARDPYGVRPLYILNYEFNTSNLIVAIASEMKVLHGLTPHNDKIQHFTPGTFSSFSIQENSFWRPTRTGIQYTHLCVNPRIIEHHSSDLEEVHTTICKYLNNAVKKRVCGTCQRPIACLLSGGLDSSLITALVSKYYSGTLETYSIGMPGSDDLTNAKRVSEYLGTKHTQIEITEDEFFNAIPQVIETIESYDTTTVRASVGNYLIGKYISEHSDAKVIFNGDGSDELTGGYLYFLKSPDNVEFDKECRRLIKDIHAFDVLRSDKCISSHGLEPRTPFLDRNWVQFYMDIPVHIRNPLSQPNCEGKSYPEKYLLRSAFSSIEPNLLPQDILWRTKEAFSDGVSGKGKSWYEIITDRLEHVTIPPFTYNFSYNVPDTNEKMYYRCIYEMLYPNTHTLIPYFWMPRFVEAVDSSARTLSFYSTKTSVNENENENENDISN